MLTVNGSAKSGVSLLCRESRMGETELSVDLDAGTVEWLNSNLFTGRTPEEVLASQLEEAATQG